MRPNWAIEFSHMSHVNAMTGYLNPLHDGERICLASRHRGPSDHSFDLRFNFKDVANEAGSGCHSKLRARIRPQSFERESRMEQPMPLDARLLQQGNYRAGSLISHVKVNLTIRLLGQLPTAASQPWLPTTAVADSVARSVETPHRAVPTSDKPVGFLYLFAGAIRRDTCVGRAANTTPAREIRPPALCGF